MNYQKKSRFRLIRRVVVTATGLLALAAGLAAVTILVSELAAALAGCFLVWLALISVQRARSRDRKAEGERVDSLREKYSAIINALSSAMGLQDDMKASHARQVSDLTFILAQQMGLRREEIQLAQKAAVLADIGKTEIAQGILNKPGELNDTEWTEMRRHPEFGARIIGEVLGLSDTSEIVLSHHERFDGQGYPRGLRGEEIPLGARIYAVADAYMAMTSDRPHRKKMSHEMALKEILRNSLTQFDPEVVRAFVHAEEMGMILPSEEPGFSTGTPRERAEVA
jgi:HD-GYP domain-containing protein (c-di-GMP phosphodiesterase class II)